LYSVERYAPSSLMILFPSTCHLQMTMTIEAGNRRATRQEKEAAIVKAIEILISSIGIIYNQVLLNVIARMFIEKAAEICHDRIFFIKLCNEIALDRLKDINDKAD